MRALLLVAAMLCGSTSLLAQQVSGVVRLPDGTPAGQVIVVAEHERGGPGARALTDSRGAYRLQLPAPTARYQLRVLRVGWQPLVGPTVGPFASDTSRVELADLTLTSAPVALAAVRVRGRDQCGARAADGEELARVWEEARKALVASQLGGGSEPLAAEWIEYSRTLDSSGTWVRNQRVRSSRRTTAQAFRSWPADSLAARGYVVDTDSGTMFYAPDADVLLSPSFAEQHCFRLEPPTDSLPEQIGVAFRPANDTQRRSDISGVLWLDRASSELRRLDFHYTGLPTAAERINAGGQVDFLRLTTGHWIVPRWFIRMPVLARRANNTAVVRGRQMITVSGTAANALVVRSVVVDGGEVLQLSQRAATVYRAEGAALAVQVRSTEPYAGHSVAGATLTLSGDAYRLVTDTSGRATISPVLPGRYQLQLRSALMTQLDVPAVEHDIHIGPDGRAVDITLPRTRDLLLAACGIDVVRRGQSLLHGVIRDSLGAPVPATAVLIRALSNIITTGDRVSFSENTQQATTDAQGRWRLCGVPRNVPLHARVTTTRGTIDTLFRVGEFDELVSLPVTLKVHRVAVVRLRTFDSSEQPLGDVVARLRTVTGREVVLRSSAKGEVDASDLEVGPGTIELKRVGYEEGTVAIELAPGENVLRLALDPIGAPRLDTMQVRADRTPVLRHREFEARRAGGLGSAFISREQIEFRNPVSVWQMLTRVPSIIILDSAGFVFAKSTRERSLDCWMRIAIDGRVQQEDRPNLAQLPSPKEIHGIEVFAGPASIPHTMASQGSMGGSARTFCGLISIWTR